MTSVVVVATTTTITIDDDWEPPREKLTDGSEAQIEAGPA
jgi:hypothetical protein